jgi:CheY-like chemotaxis protein
MKTPEAKQNDYLQYIIAGVLVILAIIRTVGQGWQNHMDAIFFIVIGAAAMLILIPLSSLKQLKAGSFELTVNQPEIIAAIESLDLTYIQNEKLRVCLQRTQNLLSSVRGSRILWIDDHPEKIVALRRLFRALGITVVSAVSSQAAKSILEVDTDYDLLVSDVQREGDTHKTTGGIDIHDGTNFIVWLRTEHPDPVVREISVVFYAAYDWERLVEFTRPARETQPEPSISNTVPDFIDKVIHQLVKTRSTPVTVSGDKEPTYPN